MNISVRIDPDKRNENGLAVIRVEGPGVNDVEVVLHMQDDYLSLGAPNRVALDLLLVAGACYVIDKVTPRKLTSDAWTRDLSICLPVSDPQLWSKVSSQLDNALTFLSGDVWQTSFELTNVDILAAPKSPRRSAKDLRALKSCEAVTLFSGGLDSLIGTVDFLEQQHSSRLMLVGHYDFPGPRSQQIGLYEQLASKFPDRTQLAQVRISQKPRKVLESSLRSRSIVFLALGIYIASGIGTSVPLIAPENGMIALNLPLTPSRLGSCSTRTMHPYYLNMLRSVVHGLGLKNEIVNPLKLKTKGECVTQCRNLNFLGTLASKTVSCSHATRRQNWRRRSAANCGYCVPCLLRRASLHAAQLDSGEEYGIDVCSDEITVSSDWESANDLRALTSGIRQFNSDAAIRRAITGVAPVHELDNYVAMVSRGLTEIRTWIHDKGSASLRSASGIPEGGHA